MDRGKILLSFLLLAVAALFLYGVSQLLIFRFQKGDVYPPYSSYRSDPLGTKAFYEGLGHLRGVQAMRNVEPLRNGPGLSEATLFLLGIQDPRSFAMHPAAVKALEEAALQGGRMVISFAPNKARPAPASWKRETGAPPQESAKEKKDEEKEPYPKEYESLAKRWNVKMELGAEEDEEAILKAPGKDLPPSLAWHSSLVFEPQDSAWRTLYTRAGKPVLMERPFGKGSIVLSSDSFFLSNEAMKSKRYSRLLSWLCGPHQKIIFDETHLGVARSPGVATLLRKYGLAPFLISLVILALLAIWKKSRRLVPAYEEDEDPPLDAGQDASAGFTNLLRRNIPPGDVLSACLEEWKRSFTHGTQNLSALLPGIQEILAADRSPSGKHRNPVQAYRRISALVKRR